jgi:hypothetical protein
MLNEMWDAYGSNLTIAVVGVAAGFLCLILVLWLIRGRDGPSPFLRGGKNRQPRLQVLDAAAVDARRRLVLVRRDDVEHLIMIGGPTDVVIESSIVDGRSPPYHTMMKTVSEPERAIAAEEAPRVAQQPARPAEVSAPSVRVAPPIEKAEKRDTAMHRPQTEEKDDFVWLGSEPVELSPPTQPAEAVRVAPTPAPQPVARRPETPKPAEAPAAPDPISAAPKNADVTPPAETRPAAPTPVIELPAVEPRAPSAVSASPAPMVTAFSQTSAAVAVAPAIVATVAPAAAKVETAPMVRIDDTLSETPNETSRDTNSNAEHTLEIAAPRAENDVPSLDHAVDLLDAARERVFQQPRSDAAEPVAAAPTPAISPIARPAQPPSPAAAQMPVAPASTPAKPLGSDFERILEEEMASNLAGGNAIPTLGPANAPSPANASSGLMPRRDPGMPRVTGATQEPAMQNEIARIFGEMSVTKDDR